MTMDDAHLDVMWTKEKLTIEIRLLNEVMVGDGQSTSHAHSEECKVFQQLTTNSTTANLAIINVCITSLGEY